MKMVESLSRGLLPKWEEEKFAHYEQFLLFALCFKKPCTTDTCKNKSLFGKGFTLSQTANFTGFQTEGVCRQF